MLFSVKPRGRQCYTIHLQDADGLRINLDSKTRQIKRSTAHFLSVRFPDETFTRISHLFHVCYMPTHPNLFHLFAPKIPGERYK
jgi:hypothetical protein